MSWGHKRELRRIEKQNRTLEEQIIRQGKRRVAGIDAERFALFHFENGEKPIETALCRMPMAFANAPTMVNLNRLDSIPPDGAMQLSHDEWFDLVASDARAEKWGFGVVALAVVLVCITDRRIMWIPIDTARQTPTSQYPTFTTPHLGSRAVSLSSVTCVELTWAIDPVTNLPSTLNDFPGGVTCSNYLRLELEGETAITGSHYPIWLITNLPDSPATTPELQFWISDNLELVANLLAMSMKHVGIEVRPTKYSNILGSDRPDWKPAYLQYPDLFK